METVALKSVAFVDDDATSRYVLAKHLVVLGFQAVAIEPEAAEPTAESIAKCAPSLVILDINLGYASGLDVVRHLRKNGYRGAVIALTNEQFDESAGQGRLADFDVYWRKPLDPDQLKAYLLSVR